MRHIQHPGNPPIHPVVAVSCLTDSFNCQIEPGKTLLDSINQVIQKTGMKSGVLRLSGGALGHFCYYMPALSQKSEYAVYFSDRYDVAGVVKLESASVTFGLRDGLPWLHCHAIWVEPDGSRRCGHLIPDINFVVEPIQADLTVLDGATFTVSPDAETNFSLFTPFRVEKLNNTKPMRSGFALRLAPNIDVCHALETFCAENELDDVEILGGVGSTVGAEFEKGEAVDPFVTEVFIRSGRIKMSSQGAHQAEIDVSLIDYTGGLSEGRLKRGENPVLVTFELVLRPN